MPFMKGDYNMNSTDVTIDDIINTIDENYTLFFQILDNYLGNHNLEDVKKRLAETWFRGGGVYRILLTTMGDYLENNPSSLVAFYKKCQRKEEDPHYEDLITTLLVAILSAVVTVLTQTAIEKVSKKLQKKQDNTQDLLKILYSDQSVDFESLLTQISKFEGPLKHVLTGFLLRDKMWKKEITKTEHDKLLMRIEKDGVSVEFIKEIEKQYIIHADEAQKILPDITKEFYEKILTHEKKGR